MAFPDVTTLIDDFNRANGAVTAGAGSTIWATTTVSGAAQQGNVTSNALTTGADVGYMSLASFGPDVDFFYTIATLPTASNYFANYYNVTSPGASFNARGILFFVNQATAQFSLRRFVAGAGTTWNTQNFAVNPVVGDKLGWSQRGNDQTVWHWRAATGVWAQVGTTQTDTVGSAVSGRIGGEHHETTAALDDLSGGTVVAVQPSTPVTFGPPMHGPRQGWQRFQEVRYPEEVVTDVPTADTDSFSMSESVQIDVVLDAAESATLSESPSLADALSTTDSFTFSDATTTVAQQVAITSTDSWTLTDSVVSIAASVAGSETHTHSDGPYTIATGASDSWTLSDATALVAVAITGSDSWTFSEGAITIGTSASDTQTHSEAQSLAVTLAATDSWTLTEGPYTIALSAVDSWTFNDGTTNVQAVTLITSTDSWALTEGVITIGTSASDALTQSEGAITIATSASDSWTFNDGTTNVQSVNLITSTDSWTLTEGAISIGTSAADSLTHSEAQSLAVTLAASDTQTQSEGVLTIATSAAETHTQSEAQILADVLAAIDAATVTDSTTALSITKSATDSWIFNDSIASAGPFASSPGALESLIAVIVARPAVATLLDSGTTAAITAKSADVAIGLNHMSFVTAMASPVPANWWKFDETSGTTAASAVGGAAGTLQSPAAFGAPGGTGRSALRSVSFPGNSTAAMVLMPASGLVGDFTLSAWVYCTGPGTIGATPYCAVMGNSASGNHRLLFNTTDNFILGQFGGANVQSANGSVAQNRWHLVGYSWDGTTGAAAQKVWIDGLLAATASGTSVTPLSGAFFVGSYGNPGANYMWKGRIDEPAIYNVTLTAQQWMNIWLAGKDEIDSYSDHNADVVDTIPSVTVATPHEVATVAAKHHMAVIAHG